MLNGPKLKKLGKISFLIIVLSTHLFSDSFEKGMDLLTDGKFMEACQHFHMHSEEVKIKYLNVKNTRQPKKQKLHADEYCALLLGLSYSLFKMENLTQSQTVAENIAIFFE